MAKLKWSYHFFGPLCICKCVVCMLTGLALQRMCHV